MLGMKFFCLQEIETSVSWSKEEYIKRIQGISQKSRVGVCLLIWEGNETRNWNAFRSLNVLCFFFPASLFVAFFFFFGCRMVSSAAKWQKNLQSTWQFISKASDCFTFWFQALILYVTYRWENKLVFRYLLYAMS